MSDDEPDSPPPTNSHRIEVPLHSSAAMVTSAIAVVSYLDDEGKNCYQVRYEGDLSLSNYLGLTILAQQQIMDDFT